MPAAEGHHEFGWFSSAVSGVFTAMRDVNAGAASINADLKVGLVLDCDAAGVDDNVAVDTLVMRPP